MPIARYNGLNVFGLHITFSAASHINHIILHSPWQRRIGQTILSFQETNINNVHYMISNTLHDLTFYRPSFRVFGALFWL